MVWKYRCVSTFGLRALVACLALHPQDAWALESAGLKGVVVDASSGERLARVRVRLVGPAAEPNRVARDTERHPARETITNELGEFSFENLDPGEYTVSAETVGYRLHSEHAVVSADTTRDITIALTGDAVRLNETVTVTASDPFAPVIASSPSETRLGAEEIRNLSSVLLDDPLRSMSSLPGVSAPDDNRSSFAVRGAPFQHIGVFLDDVPIRTPSHAFGASVGDGFSISLLNDRVLDNVTLMSVAPPPAYGGEIGAAVAAETRDGSREKPLFHASLSLLDANLLGEGPLTGDKRGSWFVAFRQSYINIRRKQTGGQQKSGLDFTDLQGKLNYDLSPASSVSIHVLTGSDSFNADAQTLGEHFRGPNTVTASSGNTALVKANWRFTPSSTLIFSTTAAYQHATEDEQSQTNTLLASSRYQDVSGQTNVTWSWSPSAALRAGYAVHRATDHGTSALALFENPVFNSANAYEGSAVSQYAFAQQDWTSLSGRVHLGGGLRWQANNRVDTPVVLPFASAALRLTPGSKIELGWGQYAQFPEIDMIELAAGGLLPEKSTHYVAAYERRLDAQTRIRIEAYDRENRDVLDTPDIYPRLQAGQITWPSSVPLWKNAYDGYSRGVQVMLQRRSANRLTGWIGYTLGYNRQWDHATHTWFDSDNDVRHALNVYAAYRLTPSVNLNGRFNYGSGSPIPGYFQVNGDFTTLENQTLVSQRNASRLPAYERLDIRLNKSFVHPRWKLTLYGEMLNVLNHQNIRYMGIVGNYGTQGWANLATSLSRFPAVGISLDF